MARPLRSRTLEEAHRAVTGIEPGLYQAWSNDRRVGPGSVGAMASTSGPFAGFHARCAIEAIRDPRPLAETFAAGAPTRASGAEESLLSRFASVGGIAVIRAPLRQVNRGYPASRQATPKDKRDRRSMSVAACDRAAASLAAPRNWIRIVTFVAAV